MSARGTHITSPVDDIARLWFYPFPARPTKVARAIRVGTTHVAVGENGRIYSSQAQGPFRWSSIRRMAQTVDGLIALGMLTPAAVQQHKDAEQEERDARDRRMAATQMLEVHEHCGVRLTESQLKRLRIAADKKSGSAA